MKHEEHIALVRQLEARIPEQPAPGVHPWSWLQGCWTLIKRIGPAFRETRYPSKQLKDESWTRFQSLVSDLKARQALLEDASLQTRDRLLAALPKSGFVGFDMAGALQQTSLASAEPLEAGEQAPAKLVERQMLKHASDACAEVLKDLMGCKWQLSPGHYKQVSDALREARQSAQKAFDSRREKQREAAAAKQAAQGREKAARPAKTSSVDKARGGRKEGSAPADEERQKARRAAALKRECAEEQVRLDHKRGVLAALEKSLTQITDEAQRAQKLRYCEEHRQDIAVLETNLARLQAELG